MTDPVSTYLDGLREGRRNGFAEAISQLREPSEEMVAALADVVRTAPIPWHPETIRAALTAAADAMGEKKD